ncbi:MAG: hypothetical protein SCJ97_03205 [Bacillota bacterium]|nr:hypothetical protein [Bacillota bacterium]
MPWWGWVLIVVAIAIILPLKIKVWKMLFLKPKKEEPDDDY